MKKKNLTSDNKLIVGITITVLFIILSIYFLIVVKNQTATNSLQNNPTPSFIPDYERHYITPTIVTSQSKDMIRAYHPVGKFWFEYPEEWQMFIEDIGYNDHFYSVYFHPVKKTDDFQITMINGGKGLPNFDSDKIEYKNINGINTKWWTLYRENKPFQLEILFLDAKDSDKLNAISVSLPTKNSERLYSQLADLIATIE